MKIKNLRDFIVPLQTKRIYGQIAGNIGQERSKEQEREKKKRKSSEAGNEKR